jgi:hypothetical protein
MGGKEKQWEARIIEQIPDASIVWESVDGTSNRGAITFEPLGTDSTRLTVVMEYEPEGFIEKAADLLGVPSGHVEESLKSFRELIENKNTSTEGWRGRIESTDSEKASIDKDMAAEPAYVGKDMPAEPTYVRKDMTPEPGHVDKEMATEPAHVDEGTAAQSAYVDKDMIPEPATSVGGFRASNEEEAYGHSLPVTETQGGEHEASMVARPNVPDQELKNGHTLTQETATPSVITETINSVPDRAFQAVPVTDLETGEHEAGMVARASDKEGTRKAEPTGVALNDVEGKAAYADTTEGFQDNSFFEPDPEEIARRAYQLYLARGQIGGHEMDDWIEAKRQLLEESRSKV